MATPPQNVQIRDRLRRLARILDSSIPLPGGRSIGLDPLIGLLPGAGDVIGMLLSGYILVEAVRLGVPKALLTRMAFNIAAEAVVGVIPLLGDLFDAGWKANERNVQIVEKYLDRPVETRRRGRLFVGALLTGLALLLIALTAATIFILHALGQLLGL